MRRLAILILLILSSITVLSAQDFSVASFRCLEMDLDARSVYPIYDQNNKKAALIKVVMGRSGFEFDVGMAGVLKVQETTGEIWVYVPAGVRIGIIRDYLFPLPIESATVYEMILNIPGVNDSFLVTMNMGVTPDLSYGLMAGWARRVGAYVKFKSDFSFISTSYSCLSDGSIEGGGQVWAIGASRKSRLSATAGVMCRTVKWLYPYIGIGYGSRTLAFEDTKGEWVKVSDRSWEGYAMDAGIILKFGMFSFSVGMGCVNFGYFDLDFGIGVFF